MNCVNTELVQLGVICSDYNYLLSLFHELLKALYRLFSLCTANNIIIIIYFVYLVNTVV